MPEKNRGLISACLITRDEEACLEECLLSLRDCVDEIIIGDTGSTDRTVEIAQDHGARVFPIGWNNNFSEARNRIIRRARSRWILSIDADERLGGFNRGDCENSIRNNKVIAVVSLLYPKLDWTPVQVVRLFRNTPRIFFENIIHETVAPSVETVNSENKQSTIHLPFSLIHSGYDHETEEKHRRYIPLIHKQLSFTPEKTYYYHHLGIIYQALGDIDKAITTWQTGIEVARKKKDISILDACSFIDYITYLQENDVSARNLLNIASDFFPRHPDILWLNSRELFTEGKYREAIPYLLELMALGVQKGYDTHVSYYSRMFDELAYDLVGMCYLNLKEYRESVPWFGKALQTNKNRKEYSVKMKIAEAYAEK
jgi:glycosyltransferase involved in cell wall biosynthesis